MDPPPLHQQAQSHDVSPASSGPAASLSPPLKRRRTASALSDCCRTCRLRKVKCGGKPGHGPCVNCSRLELACSFVTANSSRQPSGKVSRTTPSHSHTEAGTLRKRAQRACRQCHSHKTKCSGDLPRCKRCEAAGLPCEYVAARRNFASVAAQPSTPDSPVDTATSREPQGSHQAPRIHPAPAMPDIQASSRQSSVPSTATASAVSEAASSPSLIAGVGNRQAPDAAPRRALDAEPTGNFVLQIDKSHFTPKELLQRRDLIKRHMDAYFENLYWIPSLGFFHPQTAYRQIEDGTFHPAHAAAICAATCFFVDPSESGREFGRKCADQVDFFLFRNCHKFEQDTLCAFALSGVYSFLNGSFAKVWQCSGMAVRLMLGLQISWDSSANGRSFIEQETGRRIAWQIFNMDRLLAGGFDEYISCRVDIMKIRLPCNDRAYRDNCTITTEKLYDSTNAQSRNALGLHGHQLRLVEVTHRIQAATRKLMTPGTTNRSNLEPSKVMEEISALQGELSKISIDLPNDLKLSDNSISRYVAAQERPGFVFLHTHLFAAHIDLYRFALPGMRDLLGVDLSKNLPREFLVKSQKQAVAHALCLARFCDAVLRVFDKLPKKQGKVQLAGDCTVAHMATQSLRVLLIAMQHNLYQGVAENSSAPLWRSEAADETHVRKLINSLLRISEPWTHILQVSRHAYNANVAMVAEFERTRRFADQKGTSRRLVKATKGSTPLPGPHYILENLHAGVAEDEKRSKADATAAHELWFGTPRSPSASSQPTTYSAAEAEYEGEDAPPGLPLYLRVSAFETPEVGPDAQPQNQYPGGVGGVDGGGGGGDGGDSGEFAPKQWAVPDLEGMLPPGHIPHFLGHADGIPLVQLEGGGPGAPPPPPGLFDGGPPPPFVPQFVDDQVGMFLGYPPQYAPPSAAAPGQPTYMQQASFG